MHLAGLGELAAIITASSWAVSSYIHSTISRAVGVSSLTLMRVPMQLLILGLLSLGMGAVAPVPLSSVALLSLSGILGVAIGDLFLYAAIVLIGPHLGVLMQSMFAVLTAILGYVMLGERLGLQAAWGIAFTTAGVAIVVTEGRGGAMLLRGQEAPSRRELVRGVGFGLISATLMAFGFIAFKAAMRAEGLSPVWASTIRIVAAGLFLWVGGLVRRWPQEAVKKFRARPEMVRLIIIGGLFSGLGLWLAGVALAMAPVGVASALIALQPIMVMLLASLWNRRLPSRLALLGTIVAFMGSALVCLR